MGFCRLGTLPDGQASWDIQQCAGVGLCVSERVPVAFVIFGGEQGVVGISLIVYYSRHESVAVKFELVES